MITGVLFDMDGLLVDSEPLWQRAEIEVFASVGVELTREACLETRGRRVDEVVRHWFERSPWTGRSVAAVRDAIVTRVVDLVRTEGTIKDGVVHALDFFAARGLPLGIASSSDYAVIEAVLDRLELRSCFAIVHSGEEEAHGKPHPDVYRGAARKLDRAPESCLALEDSPSGVASAKAAGMRCIAVVDASGVDPAEREVEANRLAGADLVLRSLGEIDAVVWQRVSNRR